jgi:ribosomal protein S12 methylthiotransferase
MKVFLVSLGCPRNLRDCEVMVEVLERNGFLITESPEGADTAIVNTCAFIKEAEEESLEVIAGLIELKRESKITNVVIAGCLSTKYRDHFVKKPHLFKHIDACIGPGEIFNVAALLKKLASRDTRATLAEINYQSARALATAYTRRSLTPRHYAYLKITEGCSNCCSYCIIPRLRGPHQSRPLETLLREARAFAAAGAREIILVGQDTTRYGTDLYRRYMLDELLHELSGIRGIRWIRILYAHPAHLESSTIRLIGCEKKLCRSIDLPIQHSSDKILRLMHRGYDTQKIRALVSLIRAQKHHIAIRTSIIVGFPQETEKDFADLLDFIQQVCFDRLGCFTYSREPHTKAYARTPQVPQAVTRRRFEQVMKIQQQIAQENNGRLLGMTLPVIIDEQSDKNTYIARTQYDAPEVDGVVYVRSKKKRTISDIIEAKVTGALEYDLLADAV